MVPPSPLPCPAAGEIALKSRSWGAILVVNQFRPFSLGQAFTCKLGSHHASSKHPEAAYSVVLVPQSSFHSLNRATRAWAGTLWEVLAGDPILTPESGRLCSFHCSFKSCIYFHPPCAFCRYHPVIGISPKEHREGSFMPQHPGPVISTETGFERSEGSDAAEHGLVTVGNAEDCGSGGLEMSRLGSHCVKGCCMCHQCSGTQLPAPKCQAKPRGSTEVAGPTVRRGCSRASSRPACGQPLLPG